jgi:hypothetical protein
MAGSLEHLLKVIWGSLDGCLLAHALCGTHERIPRLLLAPLLLLRAVGGTFASVLVPLSLASGAVENRSDHLLARSMAGGDVKELLGGSWVLAPQVVDQGLIGGP